MNSALGEFLADNPKYVAGRIIAQGATGAAVTLLNPVLAPTVSYGILLPAGGFGAALRKIDRGVDDQLSLAISILGEVPE